MNPFDFWSGADFELKITNVGYRNYDKSSFKPVSALYDADETKLDPTYNSMFDVAEFVDPTNYKIYDELKQRLSVVLGVAVGEGSTQKMEDLGKTAPSRTKGCRNPSGCTKYSRTRSCVN